MKHEKLCRAIIEQVGGEGNVISVRHCVTRLRFRLRDESRANAEAIKALDGVMNVIEAGGEFQVVIGAHVDEVFDELVQMGGFRTEDALDINEDAPAKSEDGPVSRFLAMVSAIFQPVLGMMVAAGIIKALLTIANLAGVLAEDNTTYIILSAIGDTIFYFLPVAIGYTSAERFGLKGIYGIVLGGVLCYPTLVSLASSDTLFTLFSGTIFEADVTATLFGIPVVLRDYSSSVFPAIIIVFVASKLFKWLNRVIPALVRSFLVPFITLLVSSILGLLVIGPVAAILQDAFTQIIQACINLNAGIAGLVLGTFWSILVMFGLHMGIIPLFAINVATYGYDVINPLIFTGCFASLGACAGLFVHSGAEERTNILVPSMVSTFFGVNEPCLYGVLVPRKKVMWSSFVAAGIGSMIIGFCGGKLYNFGPSGPLGLPGFLSPDGVDLGFISMIIGSVVSFVIAFVAAMIIGPTKDADRAKVAKAA